MLRAARRPDARVNLLRCRQAHAGVRPVLHRDRRTRIDRYHQTRDYPGIKGPSYLSVHLRFGTVSIRRLVREAHERAIAGSAGAAKWRDELVWRDFYFQILGHHPHVVGHAFRREYERVPSTNDPERFAAWCDGRTGYPIVDAAMRQLRATGWMHNRARMIVASFLTRHLGVDWRVGAEHFMEHLLDGDVASNSRIQETSLRIRAAFFGPIPRTFANMHSEAVIIRSTEPNSISSRFASCGPTPGSPWRR